MFKKYFCIKRYSIKEQLYKEKLEQLILIIPDIKRKIINLIDTVEKLETDDDNCEKKQQMLKEIGILYGEIKWLEKINI
jgi:hypothetical protein